MEPLIYASKEWIEEQYKVLSSEYTAKSSQTFVTSYQQFSSTYYQIIYLTTLTNCPDWVKAAVFFIKKPNMLDWLFNAVTVVNPKMVDMRRDKNGL